MTVEQPTIEQAIADIRQLPTLPEVLTRVFATLADPDASALDLESQISADQSLAALLLKIVNSAHYGFHRTIDSVTTAIVILGFNEVRNLAMAATTFRTLEGDDPAGERTALWHHALAAAMAAQGCAKALGVERDSAFICGLLHDIGKVVLDALYPERYRQAIGQAVPEDVFRCQAELDVFGMDHAEIGGLFTEHWNLPPAVVDAIRLHHRTERNEDSPALADLVALSDFAAFETGFGEGVEAAAAPFPDMAVARLGITEPQWQGVVRELACSDARICDILGTIHGT